MVRDLEAIVEMIQVIFGDTGETDFFTQSRRRDLSVGESLLSQFTKDEKIFSGMIYLWGARILSWGFSLLK